jgi:hypothetical protein
MSEATAAWRATPLDVLIPCLTQCCLNPRVLRLLQREEDFQFQTGSIQNSQKKDKMCVVIQFISSTIQMIQPNQRRSKHLPSQLLTQFQNYFSSEC